MNLVASTPDCMILTSGSTDSGVSLLQGHHHQDGEADGRAGGLRHRHSGLAALPAEDHEPLPAGELGPGAAGALTCLQPLSAAKKP